MTESKGSVVPDDRVWYDQFTCTDWVHDSIADAYRAKALRNRKDFWGRVYLLFDGAQGWILSALVGFAVAVLAYAINVSEQVLFDLKDGYCATSWYLSEKRCCPLGDCTDWVSWSDVTKNLPFSANSREFAIYIFWVNAFAVIACVLTLMTKTVVPSSYRLTTLDENLAADPIIIDQDSHDDGGDLSPPQQPPPPPQEQQQEQQQEQEQERPRERIGLTPSLPPMVYYSAAGSGVAEVRVILSGFVLHGFLGLKTLVIKSVGLVLSVASGMSLGKEGPYVHIATCIGNIACRLFEKYDRNDGKRREVLSAAAAAGVTVAFGAPLGGVLFGLEEVAYFFPAKTLFRTFFCCIIAALSLKFLNPYGTHKIVMFQVQYATDWEYFELVSFVIVGILGGVLGALFIKASRYWAKTFRKIPLIKLHPLAEVILVALITGLIGYWNDLVKLPVAKLLYNLAAPCDANDSSLDEVNLCPEVKGDIPPILLNLLVAFLIKGFLTVITFGIVSQPAHPPGQCSVHLTREAPLFQVIFRLIQVQPSESTSRDLRSFHGGRWLDGPSNWAHRPVACVQLQHLACVGSLLQDWGCDMHSAGRLRPDRSRLNHVWRDTTFCHPGGYSIRAHGQSRLRAAILVGYSCCEVDLRFH